MKIRALAWALILSGCLVGVALAQQGATSATPAPQAQPNNLFDRLDSKRDGKVTWEEYQAAHPKAERQEFDRLDKDKSGAIERNEMALPKEGFHDQAKQLDQQTGASSGDRRQ